MQGVRTIMLVAAGTVAVAAKPPAPPPAPNAIQPLLQCRSIAADAERLACFDRQAAALGQANEQQGLLVVDRAEVQKARRSIFGLSLPSLSFLDRDAKGRPVEINEINAKIADAKPGPYDKWMFTLEDGARWVQTEPHVFARDPKAGMPIVIRRAAMGSFLAKVDGQTAVRVARMR